MAVRITRSGLGLTVGIIVLALVVLGGLYLVKERGEQARREDAIQVAQEKLESQTQNGVAKPSADSNGNNAENNGATGNGGTNGGATNTGDGGAATTTIPGSSAEGSTSGAASGTTGSATNGASNSSSASATPGALSQTSTVTELPQTGLVDVSGAFAVGLLTLAIASYVGSRRALFERR